MEPGSLEKATEPIARLRMVKGMARLARNLPGRLVDPKRSHQRTTAAMDVTCTISPLW
jgi:hypothetical protein